jgi:hypothetical protein
MLFEILSVCKGGGYRYCRTNPPHPKRNAKGLYPLHRVLAENKLGRLLEPVEEVHHDDEDKSNDAPSNLHVLTKAEHARLHAQQAERAVFTCACGESFSLVPNDARKRLGRSLSGTLYCSRSCGARYPQQ